MTPSPDSTCSAAPDLRALLEDTARQVDLALPRYLPEVPPPAAPLGEAMRHSLQGGKRLRPFVVMQAAETYGLPSAAVLPTACAFELLHTATLIHDDLPCIDNADLRRGRPACHIAFPEYAALLAGDALLIAAFGALAEQGRQAGVAAEGVLRVVAEFAHYVGAEGVIGGEAADIAGEKQAPDADLLSFIHRKKTAALFVAAGRAGAILAGAEESDLDRMTAFAESLGLLFQVTDDLLDATSSAEALGKPAGADAAAGKQTYPRLLGLRGAQEYADRLADRALALASALPARTDIWEGLVRLVLTREA